MLVISLCWAEVALDLFAVWPKSSCLECVGTHACFERLICTDITLQMLSGCEQKKLLLVVASTRGTAQCPSDDCILCVSAHHKKWRDGDCGCVLRRHGPMA